MKTLKQIFLDYPEPVKKTYLEIYESLFMPVRERAVRVLEIGIWKGESLRMWRDYFLNAHIYGWDINECRMNEPHIATAVVNHDSREQVELALRGIGGEIDIIIEDGSHRMQSQQMLVLWCMKYLRTGGLYVCEDLGTSRSVVGRQWGLNKEGTNSTYTFFSNMMMYGRFESEYFSKEESEDLKQQVADVTMFSTLRPGDDGIGEYGVSKWPTFPVCILRKRDTGFCLFSGNT